MKLTQLAALASTFATVYAQSISIVEPVSSGTVIAGQSANVRVQQPRSQGVVVDESITIRIFGQSGDTVLFEGPFAPQGTGITVPFQDFAVTIPASFSGSAEIQCDATILVGAGGTPTTEAATVAVTVEVA